MKQTISILLLFLAVFFILSCNNDKTIRIACIGDSITEGDGLEDRANESYPAILAQNLTDNYKVINLGQSGATLLKKGDWPYWKKIAYKNVFAIEPDIIILLLGANDSKSQNIPSFPGEFISDLREMVNNYQQMPSRPEIYLCTPMPSFENRFQISDSVLVAEVVPAVKKVAAEKNCKVIDLHAAFSGKRELIPDGVHPNKTGAAEIASIIAKQISH